MTFTGDTGTGGGTIVSNFDVPEPIFVKEALRGAASPDGNRFAVSILRGLGWWEIVYFDEQSGVTRVVASWLTPMPVGLTFSPDGTRLLYGASGTLFLVELDP